MEGKQKWGSGGENGGGGGRRKRRVGRDNVAYRDGKNYGVK